MNTLTIFTNWSLPLFLNRRNKYPIGAACGVFAAMIYLITNHNPLSEPILLPMSWLDRTIPFLPHSVWIYVSEYIFFVAVYVMSEDLDNTNKYLYSFVALQLVSVAIFIVWPTTFPRGMYPLSPDLDWPTLTVFTQLRTADTPANCAPSLHVSSVILSSFIFLDEKGRRFPFFFAWATLISISTLTTKQHYVVDVMTGFLLAVCMYWFFHRIMTYRRKRP